MHAVGSDGVVACDVRHQLGQIGARQRVPIDPHGLKPFRLIRCRCHNSCRRSRFSQLGTQICRKRSSSINRRISCASWRSVFCLPTRFVRISAASPIHNSNCNSESSRSNQRACPLASIPTRTFIPCAARSRVELLRFLAMLQMPFLELPSIRIHKRNLLEARVIIQSYNDHCSAPFLPSLLVGSAPPSLLGSREPTLSWNQFHSLTRSVSDIAIFHQQSIGECLAKPVLW